MSNTNNRKSKSFSFLSLNSSTAQEYKIKEQALDLCLFINSKYTVSQVSMGHTNMPVNGQNNLNIKT